MHQSVKLVQPHRKTTTVSLTTVSYLGAKLLNGNAVLCNELWNGDFLTLKRTVNDPNLDIITRDDFQYIWNITSAPLMHIFIPTFYCFPPLWSSTSFDICFLLRMILWNNSSDLSLNFVYTANFSQIFQGFFLMFCVYMYIFALYILFAPWSDTSRRLMFFVINTTENKSYLILFYLIWSDLTWPHLISSHLISSPHLTSSSHLISSHLKTTS